MGLFDFLKKKAATIQTSSLLKTASPPQKEPASPPLLSADQLSAALEAWREQHDSIQARAQAEWGHTQDQLYQKRQAYLRTLHPFLRYYVPLHSFDSAVVKTDEFCISGEEMHNLSLRYFIALNYFKELTKPKTAQENTYLQKIEAEMSPEDWALVRRYQADAALLAKKAESALVHYRQRIPENHRWAVTQKAVDAFWAKYGSPRLKYQAAYELARRGQKDDFLPAPFRLLGFMGPDWDHGGMTFAIDRNCFADPAPLLCYWENEMPEIDWAQAREEPYVPVSDDPYWQQLFEQFQCLSSGIIPLRIQGHFFFRLDARAVKATFPHFGEDLPTAELSPYLFVKCGSRDFHAHFGQVVDGQIIPLYQRNI